MKKILFALVAAAALLVGCQPKPVLVSKITLSQTTGSVVEGETLKLSAIVTPSTVHTPMAASTHSAGGNPQYWDAQKAIYAPTMMTSPCAKLSILAMPYTIV